MAGCLSEIIHARGTRHPRKDSAHDQHRSIGTSVTGERSAPTLAVPDLSVARAAMWLTLTVMIAGLAYYVLGYDQGAVSVFGSDTHVHEFLHDSRHFLGFPCH